MVENRISAVTAASRSLRELLESDDGARRALEAGPGAPDHYGDRLRAAHDRGGVAELRREKRRILVSIAAADLAGEMTLETVGTALSSLADASLDIALWVAGAGEELAVVGMGKLGARELNYYSDIDIMFVSHGGGDRALSAARAVLTTLGEFAPEGRAYRIDTNLRPEGRNGPLVRSLEGYIEYYKKWAQPWEHQALIKARASAGHMAIAEKLVGETRALVYPNSISVQQVTAIRKIKERIESHAARAALGGAREGTSDVKLGAGGIRDIEFTVQLLQLVHGGSDQSLRAPATLEAITALLTGGYLAEEDGAGFSVAYRWLRAVEHRLQLWQERKEVAIPIDDDRRAALAGSMGFRDTPVESAFERFDAAHRGVVADVRSRFERVFYRPMIESLSDEAGGKLSAEAIKERLRVLGFRDVDRATRTLHGLVAGTSRRAKLLKVLSPAFLRFVTSSPMPDEGLFSFLSLGESLGERIDALGALRDNPPGLRFLAEALGSGRLVGEILSQVPEELQVIAGPELPALDKDRDRIARAAKASLKWREPDAQLDGLRRFKRRAMLGIALADIGGRADSTDVGCALADLADACVAAALQEKATLAIIGMGKLGGRELSYASDIDIMFVCAGDPLAAEKAAEELLRAIGEVTPEGQAFRVDAALRPEGKSGPLVRTLESFGEYYARWSQPWEHQALLRARFTAGDAALGETFVELAQRVAYPESFSSQDLSEIRHLKARMEKERVPSGTDPRMNLKHGPGGLSDIEFAVQILQQSHGCSRVELRTTSTLQALDGAPAAGLMDDESATRLRETYLFLAHLRNRLFLMVGRARDALPTRPEDLEAAGIAMGFRDQPRQELEDHYLRLTRRARKVTEQIIYGRPTARRP